MNSEVNAIIAPFVEDLFRIEILITKIELDQKVLTLVITPSFDIIFKIGSQMPMSLAGLGIGLCSWVRTLKASIRISIILFRKANNGPNGNATTNNVMNPN